MPFRETTQMDERRELIRKWESKKYGVAELARQFGVTRPTVYTWVDRYRRFGDEGLVDRRPVPKSCPHRTADDIAEAIVEAKQAHPSWGPGKLIDLLRIERPDVAWPAPSTAGGILEAAGLVRKRRGRVPKINITRGPIDATESGEVMTTDHKGQFRMGNGEYCFPVTINEPVSRYIYAIDGATSTAEHEARPSFERVFREYGVPFFMGSDNGGPFSCSRALAGLSRLAVWWIKLGITPIRIHPGCPWENGVHERMHKTLKAETARPPQANMRAQQGRFDEFRTEFNMVRPHDSLDGRRPFERLKRCARPYPGPNPRIEYDAHFETRSVSNRGVIKWQGRLLFLSESLIGERVGLVETDDGVWSVFFNHIELGRYDERSKRID
jgi:transposase InsO family protein